MFHLPQSPVVERKVEEWRVEEEKKGDVKVRNPISYGKEIPDQNVGIDVLSLSFFS